MKTVFITGVAGFLGSHLADVFLAAGYRVKGCDNLVGGYLDNVPKGVEFYLYDLNDFDGLSDIMSGSDIVYHTACTAYEGLSVFSPSLIVRNTTQISVNAFTAAIRVGVSRFVHCSSMARYGTQSITPFTEDMDCKPQDPYGIAKYSAELILKNLSEIHGLDLVIAVPHNIIGPRQKYDDPFRNVASIMINLMLQGRSPIIYGDGSQVRCFSDINDDIDILFKMATADIKSGEVFNIGPDEQEVTINQLYTTLARLLDFKGSPTYVAGRPQEVKHATCSANKIRNTFGYQTKVSLDASLLSMIEYIKARGVANFEYHLPIEINNDLLPVTWKNRLF